MVPAAHFAVIEGAGPGWGDRYPAAAQQPAMAKATMSLLDAANAAVTANPDFQAVSIYPQLQTAVPLPR